MSGIYAILNIINGKYYIGSALDFKDRWRLHLLAFNFNKHHNRHLQAAWAKYGAHNFMFIVLEYVHIDWLDHREQFWIKDLDATNPDKGYNICLYLRNRTGVKASEETRKKLSDSHKGHKASDETKAKMSAQRIENQFNKGRIQTPEHKAAIAAAKKGGKLSEETKAKIGAAHKGRVASPEARQKMRLAKLGKKNNHPGHIHSPETRLKLSLAAKAQWERQNEKPLDYTCDMWV